MKKETLSIAIHVEFKFYLWFLMNLNFCGFSLISLTLFSNFYLCLRCFWCDFVKLFFHHLRYCQIFSGAFTFEGTPIPSIFAPAYVQSIESKSPDEIWHYNCADRDGLWELFSSFTLITVCLSSANSFVICRELRDLIM